MTFFLGLPGGNEPSKGNNEYGENRKRDKDPLTSTSEKAGSICSGLGFERR
jgi:hypothetical protein